MFWMYPNSAGSVPEMRFIDMSSHVRLARCFTDVQFVIEPVRLFLRSVSAVTRPALQSGPSR